MSDKSDADRKERRKYFIRQNAGTIAAGIAASFGLGEAAICWDSVRRSAIEQAGLLFDEIEAL
jgi:hypothetical protein